MSEKKSILIVDDSQVALLSLCTLMRRMGFGIIPAESGLEAMKLLRLKTPDLVLLDVNMPMVDGVKTLKHIKDTAPNVPVVMLSGIDDSATIAQCKELGCSDYLPKPFNVRELHGMLQEWIYRPVGWKRKHLRVDITAHVNVLYNGMLYGLDSETISEGGIYVKKEVPLPVGSEVRVTLEARDGKVLILNGRVIYIRVFNNYDPDISPGMAIEFISMTEGDALELSEYVASIINEGVTVH
jgi:CheY-like chemotaxis protein